MKDWIHKKLPCLFSHLYSCRASHMFQKPPDFDQPFWSTNSHVKMCTPQYASHLAFKVCKLYHISSHIYANNYLEIGDCPNIELDCLFEHKGCFYMNIKKYLTFTKIKIHWCLCKAWIGMSTIDLSRHPHMNTQHNKNISTSHFFTIFFPLSNHLQIAHVMCLWVEIHADLIFVLIW